MHTSTFNWKLFDQMPLIGIVRNLSAAQVEAILPLYVEAGFTCIEITLNTAGAESIIRHLRKQYPQLNTGAGTVCNKKELDLALDAGAQFIVSPIVSKKVIKSCVKQNIPVFPGALTATEIYTAWTLGASMVKLYPAKSMGAGYLKDIKAPLPQIRLLPTGGIGKNDIIEFRKAGADGFGVGSPLFLKRLIDAEQWTELRAHFRDFAQIMKAATGK